MSTGSEPMGSAMHPSIEFTEAAIFGRVIGPEKGDLSRELAKHVLNLGISEEDRQRVDVLLEKAQDGVLTDDERTELENLNHVADLVSLWHSKARRVLGRKA